MKDINLDNAILLLFCVACFIALVALVIESIQYL